MALVADALDDLPALPRSRSALPASLLLHAALLGAALWFIHPQPHDDPAELDSVAVDIITVQTASDGDVVTQSDATQSMIAAGATPVTAEPVEAVTETLEPVDISDAQQPVAAEADPVPPATNPVLVPEEASTSAIVEPVMAMQPANVPLLAAIQPPTPTVEFVAAIAPADAAVIEPDGTAESAPAVPASIEPPSVEQPSTEPAKVEAVQPAAQDAVEPKAQVQREPVKQAEPPKPSDPQPKPKKQPPRKQAATGGSGGRSDASAQASAAPRGGSGKVAAGGSGAESRYPGLVQSRLKRALRAPSGNQRGQAYVSFVVHADGGVSDIRVVGSTGSSTLDDAAAATVRRAAPFPPIPPDANRSSWSFTLPLRFR